MCWPSLCRPFDSHFCIQLYQLNCYMTLSARSGKWRFESEFQGHSCLLVHLLAHSTNNLEYLQVPFISSFHIPKDFAKDVAMQGLPLDKLEENNRQEGKRTDLLVIIYFCCGKLTKQNLSLSCFKCTVL